MIHDIVMPALGATGGDVLLEEWRVQPGQFVTAGSTLFVVTTDKATVEVEAFQDGFLRETVFSAGAQIAVGTVVGRMADTLDEPLVQSLEAGSAAEVEAAPIQKKPMAAPLPGGSGHPGKRLASPLARRLAGELGIDLASIRGSGSQGEILKRDIPGAAGQPIVESGVRHIPLSAMRRAIAQRTQISNSEIPHFHGSMLIDMTEAKVMQKKLALLAEEKGWDQPTMSDILLRATALALRKTPGLNASFRGEEILYFDDIHIGMVIGLAEGLLIPVVQHADRLDLFALAATTRQLIAAAGQGQLSSSQLSGGTFTVSNLGMYGLDAFSAVINPPEVGILALGAAKEAPAAWQGKLALRWQMTATLAVDHRAIDGMTVAKFLGEFKDLLENPVSLALAVSPENTL